MTDVTLIFADLAGAAPLVMVLLGAAVFAMSRVSHDPRRMVRVLIAIGIPAVCPAVISPCYSVASQ
ncbi:MAG: hypothetical protein Ct9H300mP1_31760 [Planctomycetaceae bacterium]|nr:MAG: hypothetical protein Ct9H300mP1_31760 [Planctomycetaceae bacterium]